MTDEKTIYVKIESVYALTQTQAKRALTVARALSADLTFFSLDTDGSELSVTGDDYLNNKGQPDVAAAVADLHGIQNLLGIELIAVTSHSLTELESEAYL